jgi:hydroxymethylglutaryl-CoA synthase
MRCGIERIAAYVPQYVLPLAELARARGVPPEKLIRGLGLQEMAITPPWEDVVCLARGDHREYVRTGTFS